MTAARSVTATFALPVSQFTLSVSLAGAGSGSVSSSPAGISCGATCSAAYNSGVSVTLTAAPAAGSTFTGWSGACSGSATTCTVTMSAARSVTTTFATSGGQPSITVALGGAAQGYVTSNPWGLINCGTVCSANTAANASVTLTAIPFNNYVFTGWSGACTGTSSTCALTVTGPLSVVATFSPVPVTLYVWKSGTANGTITSSPAGINCGSTCSAGFGYGTQVTLTATPAAGATFTGWSGGSCSGTGTCVVTMGSSPANITATFSSGGGTSSQTTAFRSMLPEWLELRLQAFPFSRLLGATASRHLPLI
jgi:uncharacterized repeat protein (TIGR02543 family)